MSVGTAVTLWAVLVCLRRRWPSSLVNAALGGPDAVRSPVCAHHRGRLN